MARLAFVVVAHTNPRQLARLTADLGPERVFVHLDRGLTAARHEELVRAAAGATQLPRFRSRWGSWALVEAMLAGLGTALRDPAVTHVALLSGQDRPLLATAAIEQQLSPWSELRPNPLPRPFYGRRGGFDRLQWFNRPVGGRRLRVPVRRSLPAGLVAHAAPPWAVLTRRHAETVLAEAADHGRWWRHTWIPDELFVASVLGTRHPGEFTMVDRWVTDWSPGRSHPRTFATADVERLAGASGRCWFARKFDDESGAVTDALESALAEQGTSS